METRSTADVDKGLTAGINIFVWEKEMITKAIRLVEQGAKLIGTNYDMTGLTESVWR
ncbi:MAG: hypothetical protein LIP12_11545 [Clostridiales bacterium]|nr:hypothetical protein [Clostridiales bacterium]